MASQFQGLTGDLGPYLTDEIDMAEFPKFKFTMHEVKRAGEALRGDIFWDETKRKDILKIFEIANNWLDSHALPMRRFQYEAHAKVRKCKVDGLVFARMKRMPSVRRKLRALSTKLDQIQDLGGCRIVTSSIEGANELIACYRDAPKHEYFNASPYIEKPKKGGYRSHHLIYRFAGDGETEVFNGRRIEIQIRTRLQHTWATAVESVGTLRGEDLKAGKGDADWLRLFELMSGELAQAERCAEPPGIPTGSERLKEIRDLNAKLSAIDFLDSMQQAVRYTSSYVQGPILPDYFRIQFNRKTHEVAVTPHFAPKTGLKEQHQIEQSSEISGNSDINTVFVAADSIDALRQGYPNYFGDVAIFNRNLRDIVKGKGAKEYTMPPQQVVPDRPREIGDLSWLRPGRGRRWED